MNWWLFVGILVAITIIVVVVIWYNHSSSSTTNHSIVYNTKTIYSSANVIPNTSDGISLIYYGTSVGIYSYNVETTAVALVSSLVTKGLAYSGGLIVLDNSGNLYNFSISTTVPIADQVTALTSIVGGYSFTQGGQTIYNGTGTTPANGNYGIIQYTVI